ncbi:UPF0182 family protein [Microbacterium sp. LRZ72]|uniref:UPF0182 family membrane protein n=1 Tax=Microbacterium sp. LRZ72 TaxID=2942481 RepID=UPI0029AC22C2|nr:UPF0182 family protein [Microbacterium sp. LRZ72]MDX2375733.1 UPF0182 family protein [Microbacterium sp. LRZ72]
MTSTSAPKPAAPRTSRRVIAISLAIVAALLVGFFLFASLYADWLWFRQIGFDSVLVTQWLARSGMFVIGFLAMAIPVWVVIQLAYRLRPVYARLSSQLDRYQEVVEPLRRLAMWGIPVFFGFFAGFTASTQWETAWLWANGVTTALTDPQFGLDTGFYLFALPFYSALLGFVSAILLISLLLTGVVAYLYGSVRAGQRESGRWELRISKAARIQLAVLAGLYLAVQAVSLWLDRYKTLNETGDLITGPAYVGANAVIPGQAILAGIAAFVAILFFVTAVIGRWRFPLIGTALLIVSALVVGVGYPWAVNNFQVAPNQFTLEEPYIERNLEMTKIAYGIDGLQKTETTAVTNAEPGALRADAETTASIRIMDPAIIPPTVRQLEQFRPYYQFTNPLDVDRYEIDGETQDTVVSLRELDLDRLDDAGTWQNRTVVYTHGYGMVVAAGNQRTVDGNPVFLERGIPTTGFLSENPDFEPRVYFGENSPPYSIVGAPEGTAPVELDYPRGEDGANETKTTFEGDGGPAMGDFFHKLIYAMKFQSTDILLSDYVNEESQILYDRDPALRVQKVAPYLDLDADPYPTVVDGRVVWVVDGYTTASTFPYSRTVSLSQAVADSSNPSPSFAIDDINYIRNSVKATVDAYDGSVTLYAWDEQDPLLQAWQKIYPATIEPLSEMQGELMSHVRYPTDLFKVQRAMLGQYHVDDAQSFYQRDNAWATPADPQDSSRLQPPYYLSMQMPGQDDPTYSMFTTFIPPGTGTESRNILTGYLAADSDAGDVAGEVAEDYGALRMLEISADTTIPGPGQVQNTFDADPMVSSQINLLRQGQSEVLNGNLLTLPVGGGFLYVQPVFVQSSGGTQLPTLQRVLVSFGDEIAFEDTLDEALDTLFGGDSGADAGDEEVTPGTDETTAPDETPAPDETTAPTDPDAGDGGGVNVEYEAVLQEANQAMMDRQAALEDGDWTAYGEADARLTQAVERLITLSEG